MQMQVERKNPSRFLQLFKRGRYVSTRSIAHDESKSESPEKKHEERERFAVAAVAFCLGYEKGFKKHFLNVVAQLRAATIETVELEPERWGDLVLEGQREVVVVEFKLGALLAEHQNPTKPRFWAKGYGLDIKKRYEKRGKKLRYVVVGKDFDSGPKSNGLECIAVPWSKFLHTRRRESPIETDLYDCLGTLGATAFLCRTMKRKALSKEARGAMDVYKLLENAAQDIPILRAVSGIDHVGFDLANTGATPGSRHYHLKAFVKPAGRVLGWIGYEELDERLCLSVWYYCSAKQTKAVQKEVEGLNLGKTKLEGSDVVVSCAADKVKDHVEWFKKVLSI